MKDLFRNHFPFVEQPAEGLTKEQKLIKQTYDKLYQKEKPAEADQLREVHADESPVTGAGK